MSIVTCKIQVTTPKRPQHNGPTATPPICGNPSYGYLSYGNPVTEMETAMNRNLVIWLTLMTAGRAMTWLYLGRAGDGGVGDPPAAWLMPLIGDAAIGTSALAVALLIWKRPSPTSWIIAVTWSAIGAFDAVAAYIIGRTNPWPEFFMIELFGSTMFFAAALLHLVIIWLLAKPVTMADFGLQRLSSTVRPV